MQAAESEGEDLDLLGGHDIEDVGIIDILARELYKSTVCTVTSACEFIFNNAICIAAHKIKSELSEAAYKFMKHAYKFIFKMKDLLLPLIFFVVIFVVTYMSIAIDKSVAIDMSRILMLESEFSELRLLTTVCIVTSAYEFIFNNAICIAAHKIKSELSEAAYKFMKHAYEFIFKMKYFLLPLIVFVVICVVTFMSIAIDKSISIDMSRILMLESELSELRLLINTRVLDETEESSMTERDQGDNFWMTICLISLSLLAVRRV